MLTTKEVIILNLNFNSMGKLATKRILSLRHLKYPNKMKVLNMFSFEMFKIEHGLNE